MMTKSRTLDAHAAADLLRITDRQFRVLRRSPIFPRPVIDNRLGSEWERADLVAFAREMAECEAKGWQVPECLYAWEFTPPFGASRAERIAAWEKIAAKLRATKEAKR